MSNENVKEMLQEELERRFKEIEAPDYQYVPKLNKVDAIGMLITALACIGLIIIGIL